MAIRYMSEEERKALARKGSAISFSIDPKRIEAPKPVNPGPKVAISIRLDPDIIAKLKEQGPGWQSRANAALRSALGL